MIIKKFIAATMTEALAKVKKELGDQAVILKTRISGKSGRPSGLTDKDVEVTAAVDTPSKSRFEIAADLQDETETSESLSPELPSEKLDRLVGDIAEIKKCLNGKSGSSPSGTFLGFLSADMLKAGRDLIDRNISEQLAYKLITDLAKCEDALSLDMTEIKARIGKALSSMISSGEPIEMRESGPTVVMFVGPTGAGKTSAVARLAMQYKVDKNEKVSIVSTDNFRADSSQQIRSFCRIIGCPCRIVYSGEDLSMTIKSQDEGLILIDTPGINPRDDRDMGQLKSLIRVARPHDVHLVVSASAPARDMFNMFESFGEFGIDKILVTKLDETDAPGGVITAVISSGKKLSYVCRSREVPGQFGVAEPESLAQAVLTGSPARKDTSQWQMEAVGIWQ